MVAVLLSSGDQIAGMLAVAVASSRTLEVLDLEGTGLTNHSAQVNSWSLSSVAVPFLFPMCVCVCHNQRLLSSAGVLGYGAELPN